LNAPRLLAAPALAPPPNAEFPLAVSCRTNLLLDLILRKGGAGWIGVGCGWTDALLTSALLTRKHHQVPQGRLSAVPALYLQHPAAMAAQCDEKAVVVGVFGSPDDGEVGRFQVVNGTRDASPSDPHRLVLVPDRPDPVGVSLDVGNVVVVGGVVLRRVYLQRPRFGEGAAWQKGFDSVGRAATDIGAAWRSGGGLGGLAPAGCQTDRVWTTGAAGVGVV
jgi:hypothetical protein